MCRNTKGLFHSAYSHHPNAHVSLQSIIIPVHNAEQWLAACLQSVLDQEHKLRVEVSVYLDGCTDQSEPILEQFRSKLVQKGYALVVSSGAPALGGGQYLYVVLSGSWCMS